MSKALWEDLEAQYRITIAIGQSQKELSQLMQKLVIRLACFEADMIYYKEEELVGTYILRTQLFLKVRLMEEIIGFSMPCLKLVTSETLIAPLKEKDMRDLLSELLVFSDKSMELHVS